MILNKNRFLKENGLKDYFEYKRKSSISITRIASMVVFFLIIFNIISGIIEIKNIQNYIIENQTNDNILINSQKEHKQNNNNKRINMGNVRKIFETVGEENLDSMYVDQESAQVIGKSKDMKTIEILMKNKILKESYIKRIEGGSVYTFEIYSGNR